MTFLGDKLDGLRHLLLQPGPHFRPLWRGRLAVELQLFLLQQEDEEDCPLHLQGPLPVQSGRFRETRPVLQVSTVLRQKFTYKSLKLFLFYSCSVYFSGLLWHRHGTRWGGGVRLHVLVPAPTWCGQLPLLTNSCSLLSTTSSELLAAWSALLLWKEKNCGIEPGTISRHICLTTSLFRRPVHILPLLLYAPMYNRHIYLHLVLDGEDNSGLDNASTRDGLFVPPAGPRQAFVCQEFFAHF